MSSLLHRINQGITSACLDKISNYLGESRNDTSNGISAVVPSVLAFLADRSHSEQGAQSIFTATSDNALTALFTDSDLQTTFEKNRNALLAKGNVLISELFGEHAESFEKEISSHANISKESSRGILAAVLPFMLNEVGKLIDEKKLTESSLSNFFDNEKDEIYAAVPSGLATLGSVLGLSNFSKDLSSTVGATTKITHEEKPIIGRGAKDRPMGPKRSEEGKMKWLLPLLGLVALGLLVYFLAGKCKDEAAVADCELIAAYATYAKNEQNLVINATGEPVLDQDGNQIVVDGSTYMINNENELVDAQGNRVMDADGRRIKIDKNLTVAASSYALGEYDSVRDAYIYNVGENRDFTLPDGTRLSVGENSTEAKIYNFLNDSNTLVSNDKTQGWITLDRIYFDTGESTLTADSEQQLQNIANILKNYPEVHAKFGGYTDNQGTQEVNQPLSNDRANAAMNSVIEKGIDSSRLESEGYGQEHFICPANDTPECMAQNRRVDIRITRK
ncbi:Inner membrane lipoprotein YiaD precursor [Candidatus Ornithobacterium hominis]|uniref:OmpA family protein n=1 Tax=Candidatus Ornithobacterium hominis TaxID=2497989 RepID=UPI000E5AF911|nr:OmpA family protein [Candidatus Ornithobacterium hominis]SZD72860.1 Inner membrane lipoprotein YiaD precursor [Candidatus Ornithobacterium hominis]